MKKHHSVKATLMCICLLSIFTNIPAYAIEYEESRQKLIHLIQGNVHDIQFDIGKSEFDSRVLEVMSRVPRHEFVPLKQRHNAYQNRPLPIGHGQTISQPYIVALMTDLLKIEPDDKALEIGTGSGYQAAILAELVDEVYTIEIIEPLAKRASSLLERLGYKNIQTKIADGYYGWQDKGPFDVIIVTAAASHIPPPLIQQLKPGGRMIIPVGSRFMVQHLIMLEKNTEGQVTTRQILPVRFVPLTGKH